MVEKENYPKADDIIRYVTKHSEEVPKTGEAIKIPYRHATANVVWGEHHLYFCWSCFITFNRSHYAYVAMVDEAYGTTNLIEKLVPLGYDSFVTLSSYGGIEITNHGTLPVATKGNRDGEKLFIERYLETNKYGMSLNPREVILNLADILKDPLLLEWDDHYGFRLSWKRKNL